MAVYPLPDDREFEALRVLSTTSAIHGWAVGRVFSDDFEQHYFDHSNSHRSFDDRTR